MRYRHSLLICRVLTVVCCLAGGLGGKAATADSNTGSPPRVRTFRFDYGGTLTGLPAGARIRVWLPVPRSNDHQDVTPLPGQLPAAMTSSRDATYGNRILYFEAQAPASQMLSFKTRYKVVRREVQGLKRRGSPSALTEEERARFLTAHRRVPLTGKPTTLLEQLRLPSDPLELAHVLYRRVDDHVRYDKSKPGYGNGDVLWVCDSRFGNCTDFHSLFISLARSQSIPARFEIGFPLPPERGHGTIGGYHCWAFFFVDRLGWIPVDISEADKHPELKEYYFGNLTEDRVTFSIGRDLTLVPKQDTGPLNFFVYPHVEIDGKRLPKGQIKLQFSYQDE